MLCTMSLNYSFKQGAVLGKSCDLCGGTLDVSFQLYNFIEGRLYFALFSVSQMKAHEITAARSRLTCNLPKCFFSIEQIYFSDNFKNLET